MGGLALSNMIWMVIEYVEWNENKNVRSSSEVQTKYLPRKQGKRIRLMSERAAISTNQIKRQLLWQAVATHMLDFIMSLDNF